MNTALVDQLPADSFDALLFDCDGTLAHTMPIHMQAWCEVLAQYGLFLTAAALDEFSGMPTVRIAAALSERYDIHLDPTEVSTQRDARVDQLMTSVRPVAPVLAVVQRFRDSHPMAVISGGIRRHVDQTLQLLNLSDIFPVVLTAESPFRPKPAPDLFLAAAAQLGVAPQRCIVFEDAHLGLLGAREAGMKAIDVTTVDGYFD